MKEREEAHNEPETGENQLTPTTPHDARSNSSSSATPDIESVGAQTPRVPQAAARPVRGAAKLQHQRMQELIEQNAL